MPVRILFVGPRAIARVANLTLGRETPAAQEFPLRSIGRSATTRIFGKSGRTPKMRTKLTIGSLTWLWLVGLAASTLLGQPAAGRPEGERQATPPQVPSSVRRDDPAAGQKLLERAILSLEGRRSVSAKIRQRVDLFGRKLVGSGTYLEQRSAEELLMRMELKIQVGDQVTSLLQVCDGRYYWVHRKMGSDPGTLTRIALVRVGVALEETGEMPQPGKVGSWLGLGGLPRLLRGLNASFQFSPPEETQLDQRPVWKLHGEWKPERVARFFSDKDKTAQEGKPLDLSKLPAHLPDRVLLYLGRDNVFPYQVEYCRFQPNLKGRYGSPEDRVMVAMELFDEVLNVPIDSNRFTYSPPAELEIVDQTEAYLQSLGGKK
jgi:hypothetical protein